MSKRKRSAIHVLRGGSWISHAWCCRSAQRGAIDPGDRIRCVGFRVILRRRKP